MWIVILVGVLLILQVLRGYSATSREIAFSEFLDRVGDGQVTRVLIKGEEIYIRTTEATEETTSAPRYDLLTYNPGYDDLIKDLREHFSDQDTLVVSEIPDRDAIVQCIKDFLGKGR